MMKSRRYTGVDVVPYVVQENASYFEDSGPTHFLLMAMLGYVGTKLSGFMLL